MPDITPVKKLPDGFTYEGINQYGLPIYFYLGKPCQPASAAMPNYNIPVNFANMSIPGPPPLLSSPPPAGNGSNSQNAPRPLRRQQCRYSSSIGWKSSP